MNAIQNPSTRWRIAVAVLTLAAVAGGVTLLRGSPAQSEEARPKPALRSEASAPAPLEPAVATLGALRMDREEVLRQLRALAPQARAQLRNNRAELDQWLRARLADKALVEQARTLGWQDRPEIKLAFRAAEERILFQSYLEAVSRVPDGYPSEAELQAAYERAKPQLTQPAMYRVSQIFIAGGGEGESAAAGKQAQELARRAQAPKVDFGALARSHSQDASSKERGGDIGFVALAQLMPEIRTAVAALKPGEVSAPVPSAAGFHILKLAEQRPASAAPFEQVKEELRSALRAQRQELAAAAYLEDLLNAGTVTIDGAAFTAVLEQAAAAANTP